jgi:hypothetical protein
VDSWWDLGEGSGFRGSEFELHRIVCPFCSERGNFSVEHRAEKKKPNSKKALHFDTVKCGNCAGYVMVLWSAGREFGSGLYAYQVLPWPLRLEEWPDHWPTDVGRYWLQAHRSATDENWDAAALMARSALQLALRGHNAKAGSLKAEIDDLAARGVLPPHMKEWAHELRDLANDAAHPGPGAPTSSSDDVRDVIEFLDFLLQYLYTLPHEIAEYRKRRQGKTGGGI